MRAGPAKARVSRIENEGTASPSATTFTSHQLGCTPGPSAAAFTSHLAFEGGGIPNDVH
jgi:hypothetical protein